MLTRSEYVTMSIDLNLFFLRIMKEHSLFLELSFTPRDSRFSTEAAEFRANFEKLLCEATDLAYGYVSKDAVNSEQIVTPYTADTENLTNFYTGVSINTALTREEASLMGVTESSPSAEYEMAVSQLNTKAYRLTASLAEFKSRILTNVRSCRMFTTNYPLFVEHILNEAKHYMQMLIELSQGRSIRSNLLFQEAFWNNGMGEHAEFIAGQLDPTESTLIDMARAFAKEFEGLTEEAQQALQTKLDSMRITEESLSATKRIQEFKTQGAVGILECKIQSIILPLAADHVLREANHYLCILGECSN